MGTSNFKIYNASAGSGKTYTLTKEYLKLLFSNDSPTKFRQILAITFTNKAVEEMKTRILESLYSFGSIKNSADQSSLFHELCQDLSLSAQQLQSKSKSILKRILHNYSFFEISTIDKFNHKIIKTFARDLQLSQNFEVELDTEQLLEEAVGHLLERSGSDKALTDALVAFALEKIDDDKSWNISYDLVEIGKLLFQENHASYLEKLESKSLGDFKQIQVKITNEIKLLEKKAIEEAEQTFFEIENLGFDVSDFPRQTLPNHFKKIQNKEFNVKALYGNKLEQNLIDGKILKAADKRDSTKLVAIVLNQFSTIKKVLYQLNYFKNIYGNIVPLALINEIAKEIKNIELEKDIIPISSLNSLLSKEIKNQPVPFIYERLGEKYRHYFIDEFQDTSQMQWNNLIPLISNALESEDEKRERGSLFLVGDVKQAIYRWRGGRAEQFLNLLMIQNNPFVLNPTVKTLDTNWRSHKEIVQFNNTFFASIAPLFKNEDYRTLFLEGSNQKPNSESGGFVQLSFVQGDTLQKNEEAYCTEVLNAIDQATSYAYRYSDICILVRDNSKGMLLADFLLQNRVPVISSDSLLLGKNHKVNFLISLLKLIDNVHDKDAVYEVLMFLAPSEDTRHDFIAQAINDPQLLLSKNYGFHISKLKGLSVFNILENAIVQFDLSKTDAAYLTFLMDEVLLVEKKAGPDIHSFLKHWEQKKNTLSIAAPDTINAIRIMTIHKAKGLEFPIVIFPFANAIIDDKRKKKKSWVPTTAVEENLRLPEFLVNTNQEMLHYNEVAAEIYLDESKKTTLDAINVLYVALTRAKKGLFIISEEGKKNSVLAEANSYSDVFLYYLQEQGLYKEEETRYSFGSILKNDTVNSETLEENQYIPYITRNKRDEGFTVSTKSGQLWDDQKRTAIEMGNLVHYALGNIKTSDDIENVIKELKEWGHLQKEFEDSLEQKILAVVNHPELKSYFSNNYEILNEQEILTVSGNSFRPDRLAVKGNTVVIMDYKTGKPSISHEQQILEYAQVLKDMNFEIKHAIIVYIDQKINPIFL
ncbi:UvrD-helicase domain-containing protein [Flagellimonas sp. 389]|uniref:UvrD-helicase domain-containing protein n=1 Tax=Flagellimonas sp. 389 TaxID=2835862 RepID=UPI001BD51E43|nr:UvrD-helicase domain-containing protein [Flagellimonas sp. 389]MBS9463370.1 UvrD-helicase domain-containing protein [Flagellimonas sp. 389]